MDLAHDGSKSVLSKPERPQVGALSSEAIWRINSTAHKVNDLFSAACIEARDECLWLSNVCHILLADNDTLRLQVSRLEKKIDYMEKAGARAEKPYES